MKYRRAGTAARFLSSIYDRKHINSKHTDMLHGPLTGKLVLFALPIAASSILQQLFNAADTAVVGRFAGSEALTAVGANGVIINLIVNPLLSMAVCAGVQMAYHTGKNDLSGVERTLHTSLLFAALCGTAIGAIGIWLSPLVHEWMHTVGPDSATRLQAVLYLIEQRLK